MAGMTLDVLAVGVRTEQGYRFFDDSAEILTKARVGAVEAEEFDLLEDSDGYLTNRYSERLSMLEVYDASPAVEQTRTLHVLDKSRHPHYPDDIQVYLLKDGL